MHILLLTDAELVELMFGERVKPPGFDFEFVSIICKKKLQVDELFVNYKPRENFSDKKIKFYHMLNAVYGIIKIKFFYK